MVVGGLRGNLEDLGRREVKEENRVARKNRRNVKVEESVDANCFTIGCWVPQITGRRARRA